MSRRVYIVTRDGALRLGLIEGQRVYGDPVKTSTGAILRAVFDAEGRKIAGWASLSGDDPAVVPHDPFLYPQKQT